MVCPNSSNYLDFIFIYKKRLELLSSSCTWHAPLWLCTSSAHLSASSTAWHVWATLVSHKNHCRTLAGLPDSTQSDLKTATGTILFKCKSGPVSPQLNTLQWLLLTRGTKAQALITLIMACRSLVICSLFHVLSSHCPQSLSLSPVYPNTSTDPDLSTEASKEFNSAEICSGYFRPHTQQ